MMNRLVAGVVTGLSVLVAAGASASDYLYEHRKLPVGYKAVRYVKSGSSGYVDLGVLANASYGLAMETVMAPNSIPGNRMFCGATKVKYGNNAIGLLRYQNNSGGGWGYCYGKSVNTLVTAAANVYYTAKCDLTPVSRSLQIWDEASALVVNSQTNLVEAEAHGEDVSLFLFAENSAYSTEAPTVFNSTCYLFKLWQVDEQGAKTLVRDLEPCVRESDDKAGFWDFAGEAFLSAAGSAELVAGPDVPRNRYVSTDGAWFRPGDEGEPRYTSLGTALLEANEGDVIWLQDGYVESNGVTTVAENKQARRVRALVDDAGVTVRSESGFVNEAEGKGATVRGVGFAVAGSVTNWSDAVSCLYVKQQGFRLLGVILEGGATSYADGTAAHGGGLCSLVGTGLVVSNCIVRNCAASGHGGGTYVASDLPNFFNCVISNNLTAAGDGGGAFGGNHYDGLFADNVAYENGGGLFAGNTNPHIVSNCTFSGNRLLCDGGTTGTGLGGGACFYGINSRSYVKGIFTDCVFTNNFASNAGGGLFGAGAATNCVFQGNRSNGSGGGVNGRTGQKMPDYADWDSIIRLVHCKMIGNSVKKNGGGIYHASATDCLIAGNTADGMSVYSGTGAGACNAHLYGCIVSNNVGALYYQNGGGAGVGTSSDAVFTETRVCYNTLIVNNTDRGSGVGGAHGSTENPLTLVNCTVTGNACTREFGEKSMGRGGVSGVAFINSISYGNTGKGDDVVLAATNSCSAALADTKKYPGCVTVNPKLNAFYAPRQKACRNAAMVFDWMRDTDDLRSKDVYGAARIQGAGPDMGAVETPDYGLMMLVR